MLGSSAYGQTSIGSILIQLITVEQTFPIDFLSPGNTDAIFSTPKADVGLFSVRPTVYEFLADETGAIYVDEAAKPYLILAPTQVLGDESGNSYTDELNVPYVNS